MAREGAGRLNGRIFVPRGGVRLVGARRAEGWPIVSYLERDQFEGLRAIAETLQAEAGLERYVEYLRLREMGLRGQAFVRLGHFLEDAATWEFERRRGFVDRICSLQRAWPRVVALVPTPLNRGLVLPTLDEWVTREPLNPVPLRWRMRDDEDLRLAIRLDPQEQIARELLADRLLTRVAFSLHELPSGYGYLGEPAEDLAALEEVDLIAAGLSGEVGGAITTAADKARQVVRAYIEFESSGAEGTFRDWMRLRGRSLREATCRVPCGRTSGSGCASEEQQRLLKVVTGGTG